MGNIIHNIWQC